MSRTKLTKRQRRLLRDEQSERRNYLELIDIIPLTKNQRIAFKSFQSGRNLFLHGVAGSGKTYISLYLALKELERRQHEKILIYRSTVPSRDMGFMPGNAKEKVKPYEAPYYGILQKLYNRSDAYDILKQKGLMDFESTSFIRGLTLENSIIIVDEAQNLNQQELNSLITRIGENCQVVFCGDMRQTDLDNRRDHSGLLDFYKIIEHMSCFDLIEFGPEDIVRSKLVKEYILTRMHLEDTGMIKTLNVST